MKREDIEHLATLARISLTDAEVEKLESELSSVMSYVSIVSDIADDATVVPEVGARFNVFRDDVVTNDANEYTSDLLAEMPHADGRYLKVKKILSTDE